MVILYFGTEMIYFSLIMSKLCPVPFKWWQISIWNKVLTLTHFPRGTWVKHRSAAGSSFIALQHVLRFAPFCPDFGKTMLASQIKGNMVFVARRWRNVFICVSLPGSSDVSDPLPAKVCSKHDTQNHKHHAYRHNHPHANKRYYLNMHVSLPHCF